MAGQKCPAIFVSADRAVVGYWSKLGLGNIRFTPYWRHSNCVARVRSLG